MHHNFARCLDLLKTVQSDVIQVACTVEISLFVSHNLLKEVITASLSLLFLKQQVVCRCNLVMLVILNIRYSLCQVTIRANSGSVETVLDFAKEFFNYGNSIFTDDNSFHFIWFHLTVPFMTSYVSNSKSFNWVGIKDFLNQFLRRL